MNDEVKDFIVGEIKGVSTDDIVVAKEKPKIRNIKEKKYNLVYMTTNLINGKTYIGVHTTNSLNDGYIGNGIYKQINADNARVRVPFVRAVTKYGYENFKREILYEFGNKELAYWWESYLVDDDFIKRSDNYNAVTGGRYGGGIKRHSSESKKRMSFSQVGKKLTEEHKRNISIGNLGRKMNEEAKIKIGNVHRGKKLTDKQKKQISESQKGRKQSEETKKKRADANRGKKRSAEHCKRASDRMKGKVLSEETKKKLSVLLTGRKHSPEAKAKISLAGKGRQYPTISKPVLCVTTGEFFRTTFEAAEHFVTSRKDIANCAKGERKYAGKLKDGTRLTWKYTNSIKEPTSDERSILQQKQGEIQ